MKFLLLGWIWSYRVPCRDSTSYGRRWGQRVALEEALAKPCNCSSRSWWLHWSLGIQWRPYRKLEQLPLECLQWKIKQICDKESNSAWKIFSKLELLTVSSKIQVLVPINSPYSCFPSTIMMMPAKQKFTQELSRTLKNTQEHSRTLKEHSRTLKNISKYREQGNFTLQLLYTLIHLLKSHCSFWNKTIYHNGSLILEGKTLECLNPNLLKEAKYSSFVIVCIVSISFSYSDTYKKKGHPSTNVGINLN